MMKTKRILASGLAALMTLSLASCGGDSGGSSSPAPSQQQTETPSQAQQQTEAPTGESILDLLDFTPVPEDLPGSGWTFIGGYVKGVQLDEAGFNVALEKYDGTLEVVFSDEDDSVTMIQGKGNLEGTYEVVDEGSVTLEFPDANITYTGLFTEKDDTTILLLLPDSTGLNAVYFKPIIAG